MPNPGEAPPRKARRRRKGRVEKTDLQSEDLQRQGRITYLEGVSAMEVRA